MRIPELIAQRSPFISLEFFPPKKQEEWPAFLETAKELAALNPLYCSVTYGAGGSTQDNTLEICQQLIDTCGFTVMPHLTSVTASPEKIDAFLDAISRMGIDNVLALRGDPPAGQEMDWSKGYFRHASDLVAFARCQQPYMGIGVAAYPAPHPESNSIAQDRLYTADKMRSGADFAVTQLFFDPREYADLLEHLRGMGIHTPVIPGILPIQSFDSLRRVLSLCGANIPGKLYLDLESANAKGGAEAVREVGLEFAVRQIRFLLENGAPGIHLYTLNKADMCLRLADESGLLQA